MIEITSRNNPLVKETVLLQKSRSARDTSELFVIEGVKLCRDALQSGIFIQTFFATAAFWSAHPEEAELLKTAAEISVLLPDSVLEKISETNSPQGCVCVCHQHKQPTEIGPGFWVALERIQDPGNLGGISRTAEALGVSGLILSAGCADPYSGKSLRGSMGSLFRIPWITPSNFYGFLAAQKASGKPILAAVVSGGKPITKMEAEPNMICLIGSEGGGLSSQAVALASSQVTIPMRGRGESLNVLAAATILIWELNKPR